MNRSSRAARLVLLTAVALAVPTASAVAAPSHDADVRVASVAQGKRPSCAAGRGAVRTGRSWSCQPRRQPPAKAVPVDRRLTGLEAVLAAPVQKLHGRGGGHAPSISAVLRRFGRSTARELSRALPGLLTAVDAARAKRSSAQVRLSRKLAGNVQLTLSAAHTALRDGVVIALRKGQLRARLGATVGLSAGATARARSAGILGTSLQVLDCPTAAGVVTGHARGETRSFFVMPGAVTVDATIRSTTETSGQVADDGKLDTLTITHRDDVELKLGGDNVDTSVPASVSIPVERQTQVNMRTGRYDDPVSYTQILVPSAAVLGGLGAAAGSLVAPFAQDSYDAMLADAMATYRERELGWNQPNRCAHLDVEPAAFPTGVSPGATGTITAVLTTNALHEPVAAGTLTPAASVGSLAPATSKTDAAGRSNLDWTAGAQAGRDVVVATLGVVSRAGRASADWHAEGRQGSGPPSVVSGTVAGANTYDPAKVAWNGSATFTFQPNEPVSGLPWAQVDDYDWHYTLTSGSVTWSATATAGSPCTVSGGGTLGFSDVHGELLIHAPDDLQESPGWRYEATATPGPAVTMPMVVTCPGDPDPIVTELNAVDWAGGLARLTFIYNGYSTGQPVTNRYTPDLRLFSGSILTVPGNQTWTWTLTGSGNAVS